jgi:thiamine transport system ATP-binding protein
VNGLELQGVCVTYPGSPPHRAVIDASLTVARGEIIALLGPSGCGKSSLLGGIVGVTPIASGRVTFDGADVTRMPPHRRGFGLVFQDGQLFPHRTVQGNVAFGLEMSGMPRTERKDRVAELLAMVGLADFGPRDTRDLSGGERQRVALARSLAPSPRLLALDEPLSSLDAELRTRLGAEVRDILRAAGTTSIMVTHDAAEAELVADRVVLMSEGRLINA